MQDTSKLSFVLIEFHSLDEIATCVAGIERACVGIEHEVVISSNSVYTIEKQNDLMKRYPTANWQFNSANLGFASGMNAGIQVAKHPIIVVMNPDVTIVGHGMREAIKYLISNRDVGMLGPLIKDAQGNIQDSCRRFMDPLALFGRICQRVVSKRDVLVDQEFDYRMIQPVDWVIGAFMMVKRDALDGVGLLDQGYFLYVEDMDWCKRFWDSGWKVVYFPRLEVTYKGDRKSISALLSGGLINKYSIYHIRSYLRFLLKHRFRVSR